MTRKKSEKIASGTLQKCRLKNNPTYAPIDFIPDPLRALNGNGMIYFKNFCQLLISNKTMTMAYVPIITRASRYYEIYCRMDDAVDKEGEIQIAEKTGWTQKSGYLTVLTDVEDRITKIEEKFGMNLHSNLKMDLPKGEEEPDPLSTL